jgi:hypothetical protein
MPERSARPQSTRGTLVFARRGGSASLPVGMRLDNEGCRARGELRAQRYASAVRLLSSGVDVGGFGYSELPKVRNQPSTSSSRSGFSAASFATPRGAALRSSSFHS